MRQCLVSTGSLQESPIGSGVLDHHWGSPVLLEQAMRFGGEVPAQRRMTL
jgi:hypothetical protein